MNPSFASPIAISTAPTIRASMPASAIVVSVPPPASNGVIAARISGDTEESGPSTSTRDGPSSAYPTRHATVVYSPVTGGSPASSAYAMPWGTRIAASTRPATTSERSQPRRYVRTVCTPGSQSRSFAPVPPLTVVCLQRPCGRSTSLALLSTAGQQRGKVEFVAEELLGPIAYLIVEFPGNKFTGEGLPALVDLVDRGLIRILDLMLATRDADGTLRAIDISDIEGDGQLDLAVFEGASSGLLDASDLADAAPAIEPGSSAGILVYENRWAVPFVDALRGSGANLVAAGFIPQDALVASLDATGD